MSGLSDTPADGPVHTPGHTPGHTLPAAGPAPATAITRPCPAAPALLPPRRDSIFLSVAAYCDPLLGFTLRSAFSQASDPSRIFVAVVEQDLPERRLHLPDAFAAQHLRWVRLHALEARGPCWARALAMSLYQGEDWFFQVDSHTWFEPGWDDRLLGWARRCAALNPRFLISCYPNPFGMRAGEPYANVVGPQVLAHVVKQGCQFEAAHPVLYFESVPVASTEPVPGLHLGAGCLWGPGSVVDALPYDPQLYFHGEEQALALRAYTQGWDIFHIPGMPVYHQYHLAGEAPRPLHWSAELDDQRAVRAAQLTEAAQRRLADLLWPVPGVTPDLGVYGLGQQRSLADYAAFSGIDYAGRRIADRARKGRFGY